MELSEENLDPELQELIQLCRKVRPPWPRPRPPGSVWWWRWPDLHQCRLWVADTTAPGWN